MTDWEIDEYQRQWRFWGASRMVQFWDALTWITHKLRLYDWSDYCWNKACDWWERAWECM